jgi:hypothetical protein
MAAALAVALALPATQAQHDMSGTTAKGAYSPRIGHLMILQQIRHSKLWFAAAAGNWELADHELEELQEGFEDVAALFPKLQEVDVAPVIAALNAGEIAALTRPSPRRIASSS